MKKSLLFIMISTLLIFTGCNNTSDDNKNSDDGINTITETPTPAEPTQPAPNQLAAGTWGTDKMTMYVRDSHVDFKFACAKGRIDGKLEPDSNGHFRRVGTVSSFSNRTGRQETVPAIYNGLVSSDRSVIALSVTFNDPDDNSTQDVREEYVLRRDVVAEQQMCTFIYFP